jgi:hypothetical protein
MRATAHHFRQGFDSLGGIQTFDDVILWARSVDADYRKQLALTLGSKKPRQWLMVNIYVFAVAMERRQLIDRIHQSCLSRNFALRDQPRSKFAVILLLLSFLGRETYPRWLRSRMARKLEAAWDQNVLPEQIGYWV